ncbi:TetR/AcrR family transcriptional regulator [Chelatococcus sp. GCM10030263]|uniref:TetR/AcrR family transcriptional regulator n=1 Tax=Chelatococcus sp. GCM10030263 TaxID=3273387 RepID=UPI003616F52D
MSPAKRATAGRAPGKANLPASATVLQGRGDDTAKRIVDVAALLFKEHGYEGVTMNSIARAIGISAPALYWHFASKEDICLAFLQRMAEALLETIDTSVTASDPREQLREFVSAHVLHQFRYYEQEEGFQALYNYGQFRAKLSPEKRAELDQLHDRLTGKLRTIIRTGMKQKLFLVDDVVATTYAVLSLGEFVTSWFKPGGRLTLSQISEHHAALALRMVGICDGDGRDANAR